MAKSRLLRPQSKKATKKSTKSRKAPVKTTEGKKEVGFVEVKVSVMLYGTGASAACQLPCERHQVSDTFKEAWNMVDEQLVPKLAEVAELAQNLQVR